ncbi:MAG: DUF5719 family protein [Microbacteriaceae bacterium]
MADRDDTPQDPAAPESPAAPDDASAASAPETGIVESEVPAAGAVASSDVAATDLESQARDAEHAARASAARKGASRRAALLGLRVATGVIGVLAAGATVAAVGLVPLPSIDAEPAAVTVTPVAADQLRVCPGSGLRLGDEAGQDAANASAVGRPSVSGFASAGDLERETVAGAAAPDGGASAPEELRLTPDDDALVAGAQSQSFSASDLDGFAASSCDEPGSSSWIVGGATTVGRTSILTLTNPTDVDATVELRVLTEGGDVSAPGLSGIIIGPGAQRVLPLAGFARDLVSPVIQIESRGGQVVPFLQQSTLRAIDPGGVDIVGETAAPSTEIVIPGVTLVDVEATARAMAEEGYEDLGAIVRVAVPGDEPATARVAVTPEGEDVDAATTSEIDLAAGRVTDIPLEEVGDGRFTVTITADVPVVAAARAATAGPPSGGAPDTDFAWFAGASLLDGDVLVSVPTGPSARLTLQNPGGEDAEVRIARAGGEGGRSVTVPAGSTVSTGLGGNAGYQLVGSEGLRASVTLAGPASIASFPVAPARPVSGPIVVRP